MRNMNYNVIHLSLIYVHLWLVHENKLVKEVKFMYFWKKVPVANKKLATRVFAGFRKHSYGGNARLAFPADIQVSTLNIFFFLEGVSFDWDWVVDAVLSIRNYVSEKDPLQYSE